MQENSPAARPTAAFIEAVVARVELGETLVEEFIMIIIIIMINIHQGIPPGNFYLSAISGMGRVR
jgi:hypothetical protein